MKDDFIAMLTPHGRSMRRIFRQYVAIMNEYPEGRLDDLAKHTGTSKKKVINNIQYMIGKRWFRNAYIDIDKEMLVVVNSQLYTSDETGELNTVICPCCGGINTVAADHTVECIFCGNWLH